MGGILTSTGISRSSPPGPPTHGHPQPGRAPVAGAGSRYHQCRTTHPWEAPTSASPLEHGPCQHSVTWRVHDDANTQKAEGRSDKIEAVWTEAVEDNSPGERADDEHAPIRGQNPPEMRIQLQRGDEPV